MKRCSRPLSCEPLVGSDGVVCGFKVVNIDRLSEDEHGFAKAFIKARMESPTVNQPL